MKFGGSSVADLDRLRQVARRVVDRAAAQPVVVVVSAMGKTTNALLAQARALADPPPARELDMLLSTGEREAMTLLAIAIHALGRRAISLTGSQCGIITDHQHGRARIIEVRPFRILDELAAGHIVIVGGFQGVSYKREVTTLGRGGSDSSAVALAAALSADCEIYSDVDGVYSADPSEVPEAHRLPELAYDTMQALARAGAKVLHTQAVQLAEERGIAIYARHSRSDQRGETVIRRNPAPATGVLAVTSDAVAALQLVLVPGRTHLAPRLAASLAPLGLRALHIDERGATGLLSWTQRTDAAEIPARIGALARELRADLLELRCDHDLALVSCVGVGLEDRPDVATQACEVLRGAGVTVRQFLTDARALAFVVSAAQRLLAVRELHAALVRVRAKLDSVAS
ncbi:MAG: aspartate kinase [Nannocystis sp.]|nr:aspartate kinase [Nannocystis sp.]MBK9753120.1 aspartate kinase [Nannocystis sp.]